MQDIFSILNILKISSPVLIVLVVLAYFLKVFIEKRIEGVAGKVEEIGKTSLDIKKGLRGEERGELVKFREELETWQDFLERAPFDFDMMDPSNDVKSLAKRDADLFLKVKIANVRACTYLRNEELEKQLGATIIKIRNSYYQPIFEAIPPLIDIQAKLMPLETKMKKFQESGMHDMSFAPTQEDREEHLRLQKLMTAEMDKFAKSFISQYPPIAKQLAEMKEEINQYIYRPIKQTDVDKD